MRATAAVASATQDGDSIGRTVWTLVWAFMTLVWSIFTPPDRTFSARVLIFQPLWGVRMYLNDATWVQDLALFLVVHAAYSYSIGAWRLLTPADLSWMDINDCAFMLYVKVFSLLGICGILAGGIVHRGQQLGSKAGGQRRLQESIDEMLLPPLLIPSRTGHSRTFPQKHTFSYSYLLVGIPIGISGRVSQALSVDSQQRGWFDVRSNDYLSRENGQSGLAGKLKRYLHSQGVTDRDYAFAYLVTAPRFLGYSFNPVSFWYLYDSDTALKYMILEVNNTFDERRMYLLKALGKEADEPSSSAGDIEKPPREGGSMTVFTDVWDKDFHVSPFNSRKGSYSVRAKDPLAEYQETGVVEIDNTITLRSSKESAKLVARIHSEGTPRKADAISPVQLARFIAAWCWVGFATFPRIVWEAQKLFFRKKLNVWYRPEVTSTSVGRNYTEDEKNLEPFFHGFLKSAVEHIDAPLRLVYEPAHAAGEEIVMYSPGFTYEERQRTLAIRVVSPAFYSRFVHYAHTKEAFDRECLATDEKNRTVAISNPGLLPILLDGIKSASSKGKQRKRTTLAKLRWSLLNRLRCPPPEANYPSTISPEYEVRDIRSYRNSEMDIFVKHRSKNPGIYRRIVTKLFLAQRYALGIPAATTALDWILRALMLFTSMYASNRTHVGDVLRPCKFGVAEMFTLAGLIGLANSVHMWSLFKG